MRTMRLTTFLVVPLAAVGLALIPASGLASTSTKPIAQPPILIGASARPPKANSPPIAQSPTAIHALTGCFCAPIHWLKDILACAR